MVGVSNVNKYDTIIMHNLSFCGSENISNEFNFLHLLHEIFGFIEAIPCHVTISHPSSVAIHNEIFSLSFDSRICIDPSWMRARTFVRSVDVKNEMKFPSRLITRWILFLTLLE